MKWTKVLDLSVLGVVIAIVFLLHIPYLNLTLSFLIVLIYSYLTGAFKDKLGLKKPSNTGKTIFVSLGLAVFVVFFGHFILLPIIENLTGDPLYLGMFQSLKGNTSLLITSLALGWIIGGIFEEVIFRAFMISRFLNIFPSKMGSVFGVLFSSTLFGLLHNYQGPSGQILTGFVGLVLGITFLINKRNIWLNILTHGFINTVSMLLLYFDVIKIS